MNWIEVSPDLVVNINHVRAVARDAEGTRIWVDLEDTLRSVFINMPYESFKQIVLNRRSSLDVTRKVDEILKGVSVLSRSAQIVSP